jgi:hypothetical protein
MSAYGLHKLAGGMAARWRQAWADLPTSTCPLNECGRPGVGLIQTLDLQLKPVCTFHAPQAERLGYQVHYPPLLVAPHRCRGRGPAPGGMS